MNYTKNDSASAVGNVRRFNNVRRFKRPKRILLLRSFFLWQILWGVWASLPYSPILARPISYPNSWTLMQQYNWEKTQIHIHYSPNCKNSIGFLGAYYSNKKERLYALQWNHLLHRKNKKNSQANLYSKVHLGILDGKSISLPFSQGNAGNQLNSRNERFHGSIALSYDWETRKHFFLCMTEVEYEDSPSTYSFHHKARIGIAPYVAPYGKLHTWLMLQFENHPEEIDPGNRLIFTPILRFFKGDILCEIGLNSNNQLLFNSIMRF